jgi:hypothetical protein
MQFQEQNGQRMAGFLAWDHPDIQTELSEHLSAVKKSWMVRKSAPPSVN